MDQWRYRHRPNPKAGIIARVEDFGIEPSAKTEGDECSSPRDSFGRPLLKSSEDDIFAEVPRKGSNMTATDTIGDNQPTARPPTFVPKAFTWSTITAGPKTKEEAEESRAREARGKAVYEELMRHPANQKRAAYQSLKFDPPTFALKGQTTSQHVQPAAIESRPQRTPEEEQAYQDEVYADLHGPQALLKRKREEQQERENPGSSKSKRLYQPALQNGWKITVEDAEDFLEFCDTLLANRMAKWEQDENGALLPILKKAKPDEEKKKDA
mmetsp:Transcript_4359/g.9683  ORF Transcript_4359/g.9683 Transcript_4359/m.9683 type:complete len:269 (-) Transcript_4359:98-904(-)